MAILDIIPGIYFLSVLFKLKILSTNNNWHMALFNKTYGHLQEFDIFTFMWGFSSNRIVYLMNKLLYVQTLFYHKLSDEQLTTIAETLGQATDSLKAARELRNRKESARASRILHRSQLAEARSREASIPKNRKEGKEDRSPSKKH